MLSSNPDYLTTKMLAGGSQANDIFKEKVGLLTLDEISFAGFGFGTSYHLYTNNDYWLMTPQYLSENNGTHSDVSVATIKHPSGYPLVNKFAVLPVISLKADTMVSSGLGTNSSPWIVD